jgi:hypothetical protein
MPLIYFNQSIENIMKTDFVLFVNVHSLVLTSNFSLYYRGVTENNRGNLANHISKISTIRYQG